MLLVTDPKVPSVVESVTVALPVVKLFPLPSFTWTVMVDVVIPLAIMEAGTGVIIKVVAALADPAVKVTVALSVIAAAFSVPVIVAVPVTVPEISVAV